MTVSVRQRSTLFQMGVDAIFRRFGRTHLGWPWLFIRSPLSAFGATFLFSGILSVPTDAGVPYLLFVLVGQAAWGVLSTGISLSTRSLDATRSTRNAVPVSRTLATASFLSPALLELLIMTMVFAIAVVTLRIQDGESHLHLRPVSPILLLASVCLSLLMAFAIGSVTAVLGQGNRDTRWSIGFFLGPWMLVTPVLYPVSTVPDDLRWTLVMNPAALPVLLAREALFGDSGLTVRMASGGVVGAVVIAVLGFSAAEAAARRRRRRELTG